MGPEDEEEDEEDDGESDGGIEDEEAGVNDDLTRRDDLATNEFFVDEIQTEGLPEGGEGVPTKVQTSLVPLLGTQNLIRQHLPFSDCLADCPYCHWQSSWFLWNVCSCISVPRLARTCKSHLLEI